MTPQNHRDPQPAPATATGGPGRGREGLQRPSPVFLWNSVPSVVWGFTLLEMVLALVLFAVGTVAVMDLLHRAQLGSADGERVMIATQLAQRRLEELRATVYASLADESKASISSPSGFDRFSRKVEVTTPYTNLKQVVVTVYWTGAGGETNVSLQTYRSNI